MVPHKKEPREEVGMADEDSTDEDLMDEYRRADEVLATIVVRVSTIVRVGQDIVLEDKCPLYMQSLL